MRDLDQYTKKYNINGFEDYQIKYRRKKILEMMDYYAPHSILEIGCGMEPLFKYFSKGVEKYVVVEPGKVFYENACEEANKVSDVNITCYNEPFSKKSSCCKFNYDFVICASLLHEIEDVDNFVSDIYHVCSTNTIVHFNVPNSESMHRELGICTEAIKDKKTLTERNIDFQQNCVFDIPNLVALLTRNSFEILDYGTFFVKPFTHAQMYQMIKYGIINDVVLDGLYKLSNIAAYQGVGSEIFCNVKKQMNSDNV